MDREILRGSGAQVKKPGFPGGGGKYHDAPRNGKSWEVWVKLVKTLHKIHEIIT